MMERLTSVWEGNDKDLLFQIIPFYFRREPQLIFDVTWGSGGWWEGAPWPVMGMDRYVSAPVCGDYKRIPLPAASVDVLVFDPPHRSAGGPNRSRLLEDRFGSVGYRPEDLLPVLPIVFREAYRVLTNGGIVLAKMTNQVHWHRCLVPETRVLTLDFRWVPLGAIKAGDCLIGFDENHSGGMGGVRYYRASRVLASQYGSEEVWRFVLEDGTELVATPDHPVLARSGRSLQWKSIRWATGVRSLCKAMPVWEEDNSYAAGWLAGFANADGTLSGQRTPSIAFSQVLGPTLEELRRRLLDKTALQTTPVRVIRAERIGNREIVRVSTDTRTYLAEGIAVHNSVWHDVECVIAGREAGLTACDQIIKIRTHGIVSSKWKNSYHALKRHCSWIVFRKGRCEPK